MSNKKFPYTPLLQHILLAYINWLTDEHGRCDIIFRSGDNPNPIIDQYGKDGYITLNFGGMGAGKLQFHDEGMSCIMGFGGKMTNVFMRYSEIVGILDINGILLDPTFAVMNTPIGLQLVSITPSEAQMAEESTKSAEPKPTPRPSLKVIK